MRGFASRWFGVFVLVLCGALPANAVPITYQFTGVLDLVNPPPGSDPRFGLIESGDEFVGSFIYDDVENSPSGTYTCSTPMTCGIELSINGVDFGTDQTTTDLTEQFRFAPGTQQLFSSLFVFWGAFDTTQDAALPFLSVRLTDEQNTTPLGEIPTDLDFADFEKLELRFVNTAGGISVATGQDAFVTGTIDSLVMSVPEPGTACLVALGLLGLGARGARRPRR